MIIAITQKVLIENSLLFLNELKKYDDISPIERNNILQVLNSMSDNIHSKYQKSEKDVFNMSFDRIMSKTDPERKEESYHHVCSKYSISC